MSMMASQITSLMVVYSTVYLGVDQRKHQSRSPVNYPHKGPVTRKMVPFYDAILEIPLYVRVVSLPFYAADNASGSRWLGWDTGQIAEARAGYLWHDIWDPFNLRILMIGYELVITSVDLCWILLFIHVITSVTALSNIRWSYDMDE